MGPEDSTETDNSKILNECLGQNVIINLCNVNVPANRDSPFDYSIQPHQIPITDISKKAKVSIVTVDNPPPEPPIYP